MPQLIAFKRLRMRRAWKNAQAAESKTAGAGGTEMRRFADRHPDDHLAWGALSQWLFLEREEGALEAARNAYALSEDAYTAGLLMRALWVADLWGELEALATEWMEATPQDATPKIMLAEVAGEAGDSTLEVQQAESAFELIRTGGAVPDWALVRLALTFASSPNGRERAIELLSRFVQLPPSGRYWITAHLLLVLLQRGHSAWHADWSKQRLIDGMRWTDEDFERELQRIREHYADVLDGAGLQEA
jgi:hypothetical protein